MGALRSFRRITAAVRDRLNLNEVSEARNRRTVHFETLESRLLLSADPLVQLLPALPGGHGNSVAAPPLTSSFAGNDQAVALHATPGNPTGENAAALLAKPWQESLNMQPDTGCVAASLSSRILAQQAGKQVIIIDPAVSDYQKLIDVLIASDAKVQIHAGSTENGAEDGTADASTGASNSNSTSSTTSQTCYDIFILDANRDGIDQITEILAAEKDVSAVHIISHGADGFMQIGNSHVTSDELDQKAQQLDTWKQSLGDGGDILLYGCDTAEGEAGVSFVRKLADLTGLDVTASIDATGSSTLGGDWVLEYATGTIEASTLFSATGTDYNYLLQDIVSSSSGETLTGTSSNDRYLFSDGWGSDTISDAAGSDTIDFSQVTADLTFTIHADGTVSVTDGTNTLENVSGIEAIIGGSGNNRFVFENGASFAGTIDGGTAGRTTLDYSAYTTAVSVNIAGGTATGTSGITNVRNVISGSGSNTLTSDANANTLTGSSGSDTYVFANGWGSDTVTDTGTNGTDSLDFSSVTSDLTFTFNVDGTISVSDGSNTLTAGAGIESIVGGSGDNTFVFANGATFTGNINGGSGGTNTIDFSGYETQVIVNLATGIFTVGGTIQGTVMSSFSAQATVSSLNNGDGVNTTTLTAATTLTSLGVSTTKITRNTLLSVLNEGEGVYTVYGADLCISLSTTGNVSTSNADIIVDLGAATTMGDVIDAINNACGGKVTAAINDAGNGILLTDHAGGAYPLSVYNTNGSTAATDLGLDAIYTGNTVAGRSLVNDMLITLTDDTAVYVSLSGATTIQDVLNLINAADSNLDAAINEAGNGITVSDVSGGDGNLTIANLNGTGTASSLGIAGSGSGNALDGKSLLSNIQITLTDGSIVDVNVGDAGTIQDVIDAIEAADSHLSVAINTATKGLIISDSVGGSGNLTIANLNGCTAATDLGIAGIGSGNTINGSVISTSVSSGSFTNIQSAIGGQGDDLIIGSTGNNTLDGGDGSDIYVLSGGWGADTIHDTGTTGTDTIDFSAVTSGLAFTINDDGTVSVNGGANTLTTSATIEGIIGGSGNNTFVFEDGAEFNGTINGGSGGTNTLDYSAYTDAVAVDLSAGTATGTTGVSHFANIIGGSGDDTLTGDASVNTITGNAGDDTITGNGGADTLVGGAGDDVSILDPSKGTVTITEAPGGGTDTLDYSGYGSSVAYDLSAGTALGTNGIANIETVIGGEVDDTLIGTDGNDTFSFKDDWGNDAVVDNSATDTDTLDFSAVTAGLTIAFNGGAGKTVSVTDGATDNTLNDVANVNTLATGTGDDTFTFADNWGSYTITDAGSTDYDTLDFSAVTADLTFTFAADGSVTITDGTNTLVATAGIDNIIGGKGNNSFVFLNQANFEGYIEGGTGAGTTNTLDYSAYTTAVKVDLTSMDSLNSDGTLIAGSATGVLGINRIQSVIGGSSKADELIGFGQANVWDITGADSGTLNSTFTFSGVETLVGQAGYNDTFKVEAAGRISGSLIGSTDTDTEGLDKIELTGNFSDVSFIVSGVNTGTIVRDGVKLNYGDIEWVKDDTTAAAKSFSYAADKSVTLTVGGTANTGEAWTINVDNVAYTHTVTSGEDLSDITSNLATQLNTVTGYVANVEGNSIVITKLTSGSLSVTTTNSSGVSTLPSSAICSIETDTAQDTGIRLGRDDITGDLDLFSLNDTFGYFNLVDPTSTLTINGGSGNDTIYVGRFTTAASLAIDGKAGTDTIAYDVQAGSAATVDSSGDFVTGKVTFAGTPAAGQVWTVTLTVIIDKTEYSYDYSHTVVSGDTLADVVTALAARINSSSDFTAGAEGDVLSVVNISGEGGLAVKATMLAATETATYVSGATTTQVTLAGTPTAGAQWIVTVDDVTYTHTVIAGETLASVIADLSRQVNDASGYSASVKGSTITILNLSGDALDVTTTLPASGSSTITPCTAKTTVVELNGTPLAGEKWTVTVDGTDYSHNVASGDTWTTVAADLASKIAAVSGYTVAVKENYLLVTKLSDETLAVTATLLAGSSATVDSGSAKSTLVYFEGAPVNGSVWTVTLNGTTYTYTVSGNESLTQVMNGLANQIDSLTNYTAACKGGIISISVLSGTVVPSVTATAPASVVQDISFSGNSLVVNGSAVFTYTNVENAKNLIVSGTSGADRFVLSASGSRYILSSANGSFGDITFDDPGSSGSLTIYAGKGDDIVTVANLGSAFASALSISGGDGTDSLNLGASTNNFTKLAFGSDIESVTGAGTVADFVYNAFGADGNIAFGYLSLSTLLLTTSSLSLIPGVGPFLAGIGIGGAVVTDVIRRTPNQVEVTRTNDGKIQITDTNWLHSSTIVINPTSSLTINTGLSYLGQDEHVILNNLGTINFDLTVNAGSLNLNDYSYAYVLIKGNLLLNGSDLTINAVTIHIDDNAVVSTSPVLGGAAGDITLKGWFISLDKGASLLADGTTTDGDILIEAINDTSAFTILVDVDIALVSVTIEGGSTISGGNVKILADADNRTVLSSSSTISSISTLPDTILSAIEGLATIEASVSYVQSTATIDIQSGSTIYADDFTVCASAYGSASCMPTLAYGVGIAVSVVLTDATVTMSGKVVATGDVIIQAITDQTVNTYADTSPISGVAIAAAVSVVVSDATVNVTDDAVLNVGGDLYVIATNTDRVLNRARSLTGKDGVAGVALAITAEVGITNAYLDGTAIVGGDVVVSATMVQDSVPIKKVFVFPSTSIGTTALSGTGSNSKGDVLDDVKSSITSPVAIIGKAVFTKLSNAVKKALGKEIGADLPSDITAKADIAGSLAAVVDLQYTTARIGDSDADGDGKNGKVEAEGSVSVLSVIYNAPYVSATANTENNPDTKKEKNTSKFSGSVALSLGAYVNTANAYIGSGAVVDSGSTLTVDAETLNDYEFLWLTNLVTPWLETATYTTENEDPTILINTGETVEVRSNNSGGGDVGTWYKYLGTTSATINLITTDFSDTSLWESVNPTVQKATDFVTNLTTYLNGDFGFSNWIANTWSQATASGSEVALAGSVTLLGLANIATATIKSDAQINQNADYRTGDQDVVVSSVSHNETVNLAGNINLPSISAAADKRGVIKLGGLLVGCNGLNWAATIGGAGTTGTTGVGASIIGIVYVDTVTATIEDGVDLYGDTLQVTADNYVMGVNVEASGGNSSSASVNGTVGVNVVVDKTVAQIANGATIVVGDGVISGDEDSAVLVSATDTTYLVNVLGGVAVSQSFGAGASVGVNVVVRDTEAVIGDLESDSVSGTRGSLTSGGNVHVNAENSGAVVSIAVSGSVATGSSASSTTKTTDNSSKQGTGSSGASGSSGSSGDSSDLSLVMKSVGNVLKIALESGTLTTDVASLANSLSETVSKTSKSKSGIGLSGSVSVNTLVDTTRAYVLNSGAITLDDSALTLEANNSTGVISLAGGASLALGKSSTSAAVGLAGAVAVNVLLGTTDAFIDGASSLDVDDLVLDAIHSGWIVSLAAGLAAATGSKGVGLAGSVGVNVTAYTTETGLRNITGTTSIDGDFTLDAQDTTVLVAVGGSAGFGGTAGVGIALGVNYVGNTIRSEIDGVTNFSHTGDVEVKAGSTGIIVAATGSAGIAASSAEKSGGGAGTLSVNIVNNTIEANILNLTEAAGSTGNYVLSAEDFTGIFSFAGAIAAGKTFGGGASIAVNSVSNTVSTKTKKTTIRSGGSFTSTADEGAVVVSVTAAGAGAEKFAFAGSAALNLFLNTVGTSVENSYLNVGAVSMDAKDTEVCVAISGGFAISTSSTAIGAAVGLNLVFDTVSSLVSGSTIISSSTVDIDASSLEVLVDVTLGGAGAEKFALGGSVSFAMVKNTITAKIVADSDIDAAGNVGLSASDSTTVVMVAGGFGVSSKAAVGVALSTVYEGNTMSAFIDDSSVTSSGGGVTLAAGITPLADAVDPGKIAVGISGLEMPDTSSSGIYNVTVGGAAAGSVAAGAAISANIINNSLYAGITGKSTVTAYGDVTLSAVDSSVITSIALGGGFSGGSLGAGAALSVNVIKNTITTEINDSTVRAGMNADGTSITNSASDVVLDSQSSSIIRSLSVGASGSSNVAVSFSILGNGVSNTVTSVIQNGAVVQAADDVAISAADIAPYVIPTWVLSSSIQSAIQDVLDGSPVGLDLSANILAVNVSIAGSGQGAVGISLMGNVVTDTVLAEVTGATVLAGVSSNSAGTVLNTGGDVIISAKSDSGIIALTGGLAISSSVSIDASVFGNVITNRTTASVADDSLIKSGGDISVDAEDSSNIYSVGLSISGSGSGAVSVIIGANVVTNSVTALIDGSTVKSNDALTLNAATDSTIFSFSGGVAIGGGAVGVQITLAGNAVANSTEAKVINASDVDAGGAVTIAASDTSEIDAIAIGVAGSAGGAVGLAISANVITNDIFASIMNSTLATGSTLSMTADSSAAIRTLAFGVSISQYFSLNLAAMGNVIANTVMSDIYRSTVTAHGDITISAKDEAPQIIKAWDTSKWKLSTTMQSELDDYLNQADIDLSANILAVMISGSGAVYGALNGVATGNVISNAINAEVVKSTLTSTIGKIDMDAVSKATIISATLGVAGSAAVSINATGFGNAIANTINASISDSSKVTAGGLIDISAQDESTIFSVAVSIAGSGGGAAGALLGVNVITNSITALISGSVVSSGSTLSLSAASAAHIYGIAFSVAGSGIASGSVFLAANVITNDIEAGIRAAGSTGSDVDAVGAVTISASDVSIVDAYSIAATIGAASGGIALTANVITNSIKTFVSGSTLDSSAGAIAMSAASYAVIRTVDIGVSGSGAFSFQLTAVGNVISNTISSMINSSTVTAKGNVTVTAIDSKEGTFDGLALTSGQQADLDTALTDSSFDFDSTNILSIVVGVGISGMGGVVTATATGNVVSNTLQADIIGSTVTSHDGSVVLDASSSADIAAITAGVAVSGLASVDATGLGNVISNRVDASVTGSSTISAGVSLIQRATDSSSINAIGLSFSASGGLAGSTIVAVNDIGNTLSADINNSSVTRSSSIQLSALSDSDVYSIVCGAAASLVGSAGLSLAVNTIHNTVDASITNGAHVNATGDITLTASDSSTIDSIAVGVTAALGGAAGAAVAVNTIGNNVQTAITDATVTSTGTAGDISLVSQSIPVIRSYAAGAAISGGFSGQASVTTNMVTNIIGSTFTNSTVAAGGSISLSATDKSPGSVTASSNAVTTDAASALGSYFSNPDANIVAVACNIAGSGGVSLGAAVTTTTVDNTITTEIVDSSVTSTNSGITVSAISDADVSGLAAGFSSGGVAGLNASVVTTTLTTDTTADIRGTSTISASGDVGVAATDTAVVDALTFSLAASLAGALGGSSVANSITDNVSAYVDGTSADKKTSVNRANALTITADTDYTVTGMSIGANAGLVAAGESSATATVGGAVKAYLGDNAEVGQTAGSDVGSIDIETDSTITVSSKAYAVRGGIGSGGVNLAEAVVNPQISAYVGSGAINVSGDVKVGTSSTVSASASMTGINVSGVDIGVNIAIVTVSPDIDTFIEDATISAGGDLIISSIADNSATVTTASYGGAIIDANVTVPIAVVKPTMDTYVGKDADVDVDGTVALSSTFSGSASNTVTGAGGAAVAVDIAEVAADATPVIKTYIDKASVTAGLGIAVSSVVSDNKAYVNLQTSGGAGVAISTLDAVAESSPDTDAYVADGAVLSSDGNITTKAVTAADSESYINMISGSFLNVSVLRADAKVAGETVAYIGDGVGITDANSLTVEAEATNTATSDTYIGSIDLGSVKAPKAVSTVAPTVKAYIGEDAAVNVDNDVIVNARSVRGEGDATSISAGGGGVSVGIAYALVDTDVTVSGYIASGTSVTADGDVKVTATADSENGSSQSASDSIAAVNTTDDTVTYTDNGLTDGDIVTYSAGTGSLGTASGTLEDERELAVLVVDDNTIRFGASFDASDVDSEKDVIVFSTEHMLETGDAIRYAAGSGGSISSELSSATTYYVRVIDDYTIKLFTTKTAAETTQEIVLSNVTGNTITIADHGYVDGDAVTYYAPAATEFNSALVDVQFDASGSATATDNDYICLGKDTNGDNIMDTGHNYVTGDQVVYETDGAAIGGLVKGQTYYVIVIDAYNIQLASSYANATASHPTHIALTPDTSSTATNSLVQPSIGGLEDGVTYYVVNATTDDFQLAATKGGGALSLDTTGAYGAHYIGYAGVELAATSGDQQVYLDLTSWTTGCTILGQGGTSLRLLTPQPGDGVSLAKAQGGAIAILGEVSVPTAEVNVTHTVTAYVGAELIDAGGDVEISAASTGNVSSYATNSGGGLIKVGYSRAVTTFTNNSVAYIGNKLTDGSISGENVTITADGDFTLSSDFAMEKDDVDSISRGGGLLAFASADADAYITNNSTTTVGQDAEVSALRALVKTTVSKLNADAYGESKAGGLTGTSEANGNVTINSNVNVVLDGSTGTDTKLTGSEGVEILAEQENFSVDGHKYSVFYGLSWGTGSSGEAETLSSIVTADSGVTVTAGTDGSSGATALHVTADDSTTSSNSIAWNSDVVLLCGSSTELAIDENGNIVVASNVTATVTADTITVADIANSGQCNVLFEATVISGSGGSWDCRNGSGEVTITNMSDRDLVVNDIDVTSATAQPVVELDAASVALTFDITRSVASSAIEIENSGDSDLILAGLIENPVGTTTITNALGNILSNGTEAIVRTSALEIVATLGSIGTSNERINVELVHSSGRTAGMSAEAGADVFLSLKGRLRDPSVTNFTIDIGSVRAGGDIDLLLQDSVQENGTGTQLNGLRVTTPSTSPTSDAEYYNHFRPDSGTAPASDPAVFADMDHAWTINSAYDFGLLEAAGNIVVSAADASTSVPTLEIVANTNLLGSGHLDVDTNGTITLTETNGDLRVGIIRSTAADVDLSSQAAIVDAFDDSDSNILGRNITLTAGTDIGSAGNYLDIDSSSPSDGVLNATADQDIFIAETDGDLNVDLVQSDNGNAALATGNGNILDANGDDTANVRAVSIDLMAVGGGIGAVGDDLRVDSSAATNGLLNATAGQGIYLAETAGVMNVGQIDSTDSNVRLTVPDTTGSGENLVLGGSNTIHAAGNVDLLVGDDIRIDGNIRADGDVLIQGDYHDADPGAGTTIDIIGEVYGSSVSVAGGADNDAIGILNLPVAASVSAYQGNDTIYVGRSVTGSPGDGMLIGIVAQLYVDGGPQTDKDSLILDDSADTLSRSGTITNDTVLGFGMGAFVSYRDIENLTVLVGSGSNTINIRSTAAGVVTTSRGGSGDDTFNVSSDAPDNQGNLDGIRGDLVIDGAGGDNTLNVSDRGNTTGRGTALSNAVITDHSITGMTGDAGGSGNIYYTASGGFGGGVNIFNGSGDDVVTVESALTGTATIIRAGSGNDVITARELGAGAGGPLAIFGESGNDTVNGAEWRSGLIAFGDYGEFTSVKGIPVLACSTEPDSGGNDMLSGGSGADILIGGSGNDMINGNAGNDILIGDNGAVSWRPGNIRVVESRYPSIGYADTLIGGNGNNVMIGGVGSDVFFGNLRNDLMIGETGQVIMRGGLVQGVTVRGLSLNLLNYTESGLYTLSRQSSEAKIVKPIIQTNRDHVVNETMVVRTAFEDRPENRQTLELSYHPSSTLTPQNMQQMIDYFDELESDDTSDMPASGEPEAKDVLPMVISTSGTHNADTTHQTPQYPVEGTKRKIIGTHIKAKDKTLPLDALAAGYVGWAVNSVLPSERKTGINRESCARLERQERNRRFQKWN